MNTRMDPPNRAVVAILLGLALLLAAPIGRSPAAALGAELPEDIRDALRKLKSADLLEQVDGAIFLMDHGTLGASGVPDVLPKLARNYENGKDGGFLWFYETDEKYAYSSYHDPQDVFVRYLVAVGEPAVPHLLNALNGSHGEETRQYAAEALGRIGDARALEPLRELEPQVTGGLWARVHVARRIMEGEREEVVQGALLSNEDPLVQDYAARRLLSILPKIPKDRLPEWLKGTEIAKQIVTARVTDLAVENLQQTRYSLGVFNEVAIIDALKEQGVDAYDRWEFHHLPQSDLLSLFKSPNAAVRLRAIELLRTPKMTPDVLDALASALRDSELSIRKAALSKLPYKLTHEPAIASVQALLADTDQPEEIRMHAAAILALSNRPTEWPLLVKALYCCGYEFRSPGAFEPQYAEVTESLLLSAFEIAPQSEWGTLLSALWRTSGDKNVDFILDRYRECEREHRHRFWNLFETADIPRMKAVIVDEFLNGSRATNIVRSVGDSGDPRVIGPLLDIAGNPDYSLLPAAAHSLVALDEPRAIEPIVRSLPRIWNRYYDDAFKPLVELSGRHPQYLLPLANDPDPKAAAVALHVLTELGFPEAAALTLRRLRDPDHEVRTQAALDLARMRFRTAEPFIARALLMADPELTPRMLERLYVSRSEGEVAAAVAALLGNPDDNLVRCAADLAGRSRLTGTAPLLLRLASTRENIIRAAALAALAKMQDHRGTPLLIQEMDHPDFERRRQAVINLGQMGDREATRELLLRFRTPTHPFVYDFVDAFGAIGDETAVPAIIDYAAGEQGKPLEQAFRALGQIGGARAAEYLLQYADATDADIRAAAIIALGKTGEPAAKPVVFKAVSDANSKVRLYAVDGLRGFDDPETFDVLLSVLTGEEEALHGLADSFLRRMARPHLVPIMLDHLRRGTPRAENVGSILQAATQQILPAEYEPWAQWWEENKHKYDVTPTPSPTQP